MGFGGNVFDALFVKGDAGDLACGREHGKVAVVAAPAVAQARTGAVESHERHDNHVELGGGYDGAAIAVDIRSCEGPRGMSDKRSRGYIAGGDRSHTHALAACGGVACREHARIGYAPAARGGRSGKRGRVDFGIHGGIDGNGALARSAADLHQLNKPRAYNSGLRRPDIQINRIAPGNHRPP